MEKFELDEKAEDEEGETEEVLKALGVNEEVLDEVAGDGGGDNEGDCQQALQQQDGRQSR